MVLSFAATNIQLGLLRHAGVVMFGGETQIGIGLQNADFRAPSMPIVAEQVEIENHHVRTCDRCENAIVP